SAEDVILVARREILFQEQTIRTAVECSGIGLHSGAHVSLRILPGPSNTGIVFRRTDLDGFEIEACARNVARVSYATSLMRKGVLISTTEHLLSALASLNVDNVYVELDNLELPILDGSALPFVRLIAGAGLKRQRARRKYAKILRPVEVIDGAKRIAVYPAETFRITYQIDFPHPLIREQRFTFAVDGPVAPGSVLGCSAYETGIGPARTFGLLEEVEILRNNGLVRGGSLENAVVLGPDG